MRARLALILLAALGCATAMSGAAAAAQTQPVEVARDGSIVLTARQDSDAQLCVALGVERGADEECGDPAAGVSTTGLADRDTRAVGAAVPASATSVEVRRAGRLLGSAPTVAGEAYQGAGAGQVRFVVVRLGRDARLEGLRVRALDAAGALVAVVTTSGGDPLTTRERTLLSGRSGTTRWALRTSTVTRAAPSIVDPARESAQQCLTAVIGGQPTSDVDCRPPDDDEALLGSLFSSPPGTPQLADRCDAGFRLLHGAAAAGTRTVQVELGDGRRVTARTAPYRAAGTVAYAVVVAPEEAIRAVRLIAADATVRRIALRAPPLELTCRFEGSRLSATSQLLGFDPSRSFVGAFGRTPVVVPAGPVTEVAGDPGFRVADGPDGTLCVAVARHPLRTFGCGVVAPGFGDLVVSLDSFARPRAFVQVVPAAVVAVRIGRRSGALRTVPTVAPEDYRGAYAGTVRFLSASLLGLDDAERLEYLDAAGGVLHRESPDPTDEPATEQDLRAPQLTGPRRIAGAAGRASLWQTSVRGGLLSGASCFALTDGGSPLGSTRCQTERSERLSVLVQASCATRRLTVAVVAGAGSRASLTTTGGVQSTVSLRRGIGLLTLAAGEGVRDVAVALPVGRTQHVRFRAPAATQQCGWTSLVTAGNFDRRTSGPAPETGEHPV